MPDQTDVSCILPSTCYSSYKVCKQKWQAAAATTAAPTGRGVKLTSCEPRPKPQMAAFAVHLVLRSCCHRATTSSRLACCQLLQTPQSLLALVLLLLRLLQQSASSVSGYNTLIASPSPLLLSAVSAMALHSSGSHLTAT